jgi:hypothetical protein
MLSLFNTAFNPTILIALAVGYQIVCSVNLYDIRYDLSYNAKARISNLKTLPKSFLFLHWSETIIITMLFFLNWKFAVVTWFVKTMLRAFHVLEFVGYLILYAFNPRS